MILYKKDRRIFLKALGASVLLLNLPFVACYEKKDKFVSVLSEKPLEILKNVLKIIFPDLPKTPGIQQLNTLKHIDNYLIDIYIDPSEQTFLINGIDWLNETALEIYKNDFNFLNQEEKIRILKKISNESWGESWLSKLLTLTFESLLLDPLYQINIDEAGWKWLNHKPGQPRPEFEIAYPEILKRKQEKIIITRLEQL